MNLILNFLLALTPAFSQDPAVIELNALLEKQKESLKVDSPHIIRSQAKSEPSRDVVILFDGTGEVGSYESEVYSFMQSRSFDRLRKQFPDHDIVTFSSNDKAEIRRTLGKIMKDYEGVQGLVITALGKTPEIMQTNEGERIVLNTGSAHGDFAMDPTNQSHVEDIFGPVVGKLTEDAKLVFGGHKMIYSLKDLQKLKLMKKIAKNFKMDSGRVYLNVLGGMDPYAQYFGAPFYKRRYKKFNSFVEQLYFPITLSMGLAYKLLGDRGNTLRVEGDLVSLYEDGEINALSSCRSKGEKKGYCLIQQIKSGGNRKKAEFTREGALVEPQKTVVDSAQ